MVEVEHLESLSDGRVFLQTRLERVDSFGQVFNDLIALYIEPNQRQERFGAEVAAIQYFRVHLTDQMLLLLGEMRAMLGERAKEEVFLEMIQGQQQSHEASFQALMAILEDPTERYPEPARQWVRERLMAKGAKLLTSLDEPTQVKIRKQLSTLGIEPVKN